MFSSRRGGLFDNCLGRPSRVSKAAYYCSGSSYSEGNEHKTVKVQAIIYKDPAQAMLAIGKQ